MIEWHHPTVRTPFRAATLALIFAAAAVGQERPDEDGATTSLSSLVLVLNLISDSHARPATGVVIRTAAPGPALVLVPADFVSAGDEVIVLDGGTDILRNGRPSRTVARSAQAGVALLEVEGLVRAGVEFSSGPWPPEGVVDLEFAAWPPAEALAEGAPLIRRSLRFDQAAERPALPEVSGPLFDRCGGLAALYLASDEGRLVDAATVAGYLASAGFDAVQAPCLEAASNTPAAESERPDVIDGQDQPALAAAEQEPVSGESPPVAQESETPGRPSWRWAVALLGLAAVAILYFQSARQRRPSVWLEGAGAGNREARLELRLTPAGGAALLQRQGHSPAFEHKAGRILLSDRGGEGASRLALALGDTPCLPGEVFIAEPGQVLKIGAEAWVLHSDFGVALHDEVVE